MKNRIYVFTLTGLMLFMAMTANAQSKKLGKGKTAVPTAPAPVTPVAPAEALKSADLKKYEAAKARLDSLIEFCANCEREVARDSAYGPAYKALQQEIKVFTDSIQKIEKKYVKALGLLQEEAERNPYWTDPERKAYADRKEQLEKRKQAELDDVYRNLTRLLIQIAADQKTYWGLIVDRKVRKSLGEN